jgi:prevent-host-death family protein
MTTTKTVLKARLLEILRELEATGEEVVITDHNRPVAVIVPLKKRSTVDEVFGPWRGRVRLASDLTMPIGDEWGQTNAGS